MRRLLFVVLALAALAGCNPSVETTPAGAGWVQVSNGYGSAGAKEIEFPSGTRCVVLVGYYKGGIDCDFPRKAQ